MILFILVMFERRTFCTKIGILWIWFKYLFKRNQLSWKYEWYQL